MKQLIFIGLVLIALLLSGCVQEPAAPSGQSHPDLVMPGESNEPADTEAPEIILPESPLTAEFAFSNPEKGTVEASFIDNAGNTYLLGDPKDDEMAFFLEKYDSSGSLVWTRSCSGSFNWGLDYLSLFVDSQENPYIAGFFRGEILGEFACGSDVEVAKTGSAWPVLFGVKFGKDGTPLWAKSFNIVDFGMISNVGFTEFFVDQSENIYVLGDSIQDISFGNGISLPTKNKDDYFFYLTKYSPDVTAQWARSASGPGSEFIEELFVDKQGNAYISGQAGGYAESKGAVDFGNGIKIEPGFFIAKYNSNGEIQWAKNKTGLFRVEPTDIFVDDAGNVYLTGGTGGDLNLGSGVYIPKNKDLFNMGFFAKYTPDGKPSFAKAFFANDEAIASSIFVDSAGDIYIAGEFKGDANFGEGIIAKGFEKRSSFIAKYDSGGKIKWVEIPSGRGAGIGSNTIDSIKVDSSGNIYVHGRKTGNLDFGNGISIADNGSEYFEFFAAKYKQ